MFSKELLFKPDTDWNAIIWANETKIYSFGLNSYHQVWKNNNKEFKLQNTIPNVEQCNCME